MFILDFAQLNLKSSVLGVFIKASCSGVWTALSSSYLESRYTADVRINGRMKKTIFSLLGNQLKEGGEGTKQASICLRRVTNIEGE
jgi:hypothetical protein